MKQEGVIFWRKNSRVWYFYVWRGGKKVARSTGETNRTQAEARVKELERPIVRLSMGIPAAESLYPKDTILRRMATLPGAC